MFAELVQSIEGCATKFAGLLLTALLLITAAVLTAPTFASAKQTLFASVADIANALCLWILALDIAAEFRQIIVSRGHDMEHLVSAMDTLRVMFVQMAMISTALGGAVNIAMAASRWPESSQLIILIATVWSLARLGSVRARNPVRSSS